MNENVPEILKDCGRLLALGLNKNNIQTQVNSDPKAVNLTISLNEDFHLKIVQNLLQVLNGEYVYIPDEKEFVWTKEILQENDANTDRVMQTTASKITCKFCQLSIDNPQKYSVHLEKHLTDQRKHLLLGGAKLGDDPEKNGIHCLLCSFVTTDLIKFQIHNKDCQVKVSTEMSLVKSGKLNSEANENISQDTKQGGSLSCDQCRKIFKLNMALIRHKRMSSCNPREEKPRQTVAKVSNKIPELNLELLNYPGEVAKALFKCLRCALPFQLSEEQRNHVCSLEYKAGEDAVQTMPNLLKCQICPNSLNMNFSSKDNLRMHYTVAHYQHLFLTHAIKVDKKMREKKGLSLKDEIFPLKCQKNGCEEQISDSRQLAIHTAIEHKKLKKALMTAKLFENEQVKNEVIKLLVEGDESLTSDNSFQDQSKTESNSGQKSKTTANLLDTPAPEKATAPAKLPPTKVVAPKKTSFPAKASVKTSKAPTARSTSNAPTKVRVLKVVSEIRCPKCEEVFSSIEIMRLHTCDSIMDRRDRKEGQDRDRQTTNRFGLESNLNPADINTSFSTNATNSTFEDQENVSLSKVKKRRRSGQQQPKNDKSANKKTRLEDKKKFLVDSSSDESNSDGDIDTSHPEETIENIEKLIKDTPKAKPKKPVKAVPSKSQNVGKNVQQESKKVEDTLEKQQNIEKDVPQKSHENNINGAKKKRNDHDKFSDEEEDSDEDVITCKGCDKQFKTYLDYVHKDHMKVSTPCWKEYCKQDD